MAKGTRTNDSMQETLRGILQDVAFAMSLPDADADYLGQLQNVILGKLREPYEAHMAQYGPGGAGGMAPPAPAMTRGPSPAPGPGGIPPGLRNGGSMPNPDELRRLVGGL